MKKLICLITCIALLLFLCLPAWAESAPSLSLGDQAVTVIKGKTTKFAPKAENVANTKKLKYTWESSDPEVATVNAGTVKAVNAGTATISCAAVLEDGTELKASVQVVVVIPVKALKSSAAKETMLYVGESFLMEYTISPEDATDKSLEWTSSDPAVASVDADGKVTAVAPGRATITAATLDGSKKKAQAKVYIPTMTCVTESVSVDTTAGSSFTFRYYGEDWEKNVTVTTKGVRFNHTVIRSGNDVKVDILPVSVGSGTITFKDKKDAKSPVTVGVEVSKDAIALNQYVLITDFTFVNKDLVKFTYLNNSGQDIDSLEFRIIPRNDIQDQIFLGNSIGEEKVHITYRETLKANKTKTKSLSSSYRHYGLASMEIAVSQIKFTDGSVIRLSDNGMYWYSTLTNAYLDKPEKDPVNAEPTPEEKEKAAFRTGFTSSYIALDMAPHYGYRYAGIYVSRVTENSAAAIAGLQKGDLIVAVNGVLLADDRGAFDKAKAQITDGGSITLTVERPGEADTLDLTLTR